jgi:hypothetical protein
MMLLSQRACGTAERLPRQSPQSVLLPECVVDCSTSPALNPSNRKNQSLCNKGVAHVLCLMIKACIVSKKSQSSMILSFDQCACQRGAAPRYSVEHLSLPGWPACDAHVHMHKRTRQPYHVIPTLNAWGFQNCKLQRNADHYCVAYAACRFAQTVPIHPDAERQIPQNLRVDPGRQPRPHAT